MELNIDSFMTPKGVLSILASLMVVCSFILSAPVIAQQFSTTPYGGVNAGGLQQVTIPGLEGLTGFVSGENQLSLATYLVSQDGYSCTSKWSGWLYPARTRHKVPYIP